MTMNQFLGDTPEAMWNVRPVRSKLMPPVYLAAYGDAHFWKVTVTCSYVGQLNCEIIRPGFPTMLRKSRKNCG